MTNSTTININLSLPAIDKVGLSLAYVISTTVLFSLQLILPPLLKKLGCTTSAPLTVEVLVKEITELWMLLTENKDLAASGEVTTASGKATTASGEAITASGEATTASGKAVATLLGNFKATTSGKGRA